jgi:hypothetical protein
MLGEEGDRDHKFSLVGRWNIGWGPSGRGCGFGSRGFDTRGCFLLMLPTAGLGAAVDLGSGFLGLAIFLVAVTLA